MVKDHAGARRLPPGSDDPHDDPLDGFFDVPAAVLCAACGQSDCPGCVAASEGESGVIAIVPWERSGGTTWARLWATANASTRGAEAFFAVLPDGEISPAVRFALLAELLTVASMAALALPLVAFTLPSLAAAVVTDAELRWRVLRWIAIGVPAVALWMVGAHVTHGAALDAGARRLGARPERRRAVRFGLYACGWDLMVGPVGAVVTLFTQNLRATLEIAELAVGVPERASIALLRGVYGLKPSELPRARRVARVASALVAVASAGAVSACLVAALRG